jgi:nitrous oxide reductase accessory protein NosL
MILDPVLSSRKGGTEIRGRESTMKTSSAWLLSLFVLAAFFTPALALEDVSVHPSCAICGMDREQFGHSRMLIVFQDGASFGTCSLRCAALILKAEEGRKPRSVKVADYNTRELIEAEEAAWVIGGTKPGVMTGRAKWAFRNEEDRERFLREFGGARSTYREALREALKELE